MDNLRSFLVGLIIILTCSTILLFFSDINNSLGTQTMRLYEMNRCFQDGQIPCRWAPDLGSNYGYPLFNYYGPLPYYIGELFFLITGSLAFSIKLVFLISLVGAYLFARLFLKRIFSPKEGTFFAVLYSLLSYFLVIKLLSGSPGELWSLMLLPGLGWIFRNIELQRKTIIALAGGLFGASFILSHNISAALFMPLSFIFLAKSYSKIRDIKLVKPYFILIIFSILLSSFYFLPLILESNFTHMGKVPWRYIFTTDSTGQDFLPKSTEKPPTQPGMGGYEILTGDLNMLNFKSGTNWMSFDAAVRTHSIIRLSQYYFPEWILIVDGKQENIEYTNNNLGLITLILSPGTHVVYLKLLDTPIRQIGNLLTIMGVVIYLVFLLMQIPRIRKWLTYYLRGFYR